MLCEILKHHTTFKTKFDSEVCLFNIGTKGNVSTESERYVCTSKEQKKKEKKQEPPYTLLKFTLIVKFRIKLNRFTAVASQSRKYSKYRRLRCRKTMKCA